MVELDLETDHTSGPQTPARRLYWRSLSAGQGHQSLGFTTLRTYYITQIVSRQPGPSHTGRDGLAALAVYQR